MSASKKQSVKRVNNNNTKTNTNTNTKTKRRGNNKRLRINRVATKTNNKNNNKKLSRNVVSNKNHKRRGAKNTTRKNNNVNGRRNGRKGGGAPNNNRLRIPGPGAGASDDDEEPTHMTLKNVRKQIGERQLREALNEDSTDSSNESTNNIFEEHGQHTRSEEPNYGSANVPTSPNKKTHFDDGTVDAHDLGKKWGFNRGVNARKAMTRSKAQKMITSARNKLSGFKTMKQKLGRRVANRFPYSTPGSIPGEGEIIYTEPYFNKNQTYTTPTPNPNNLVNIAEINHDATRARAQVQPAATI